MSFVLALPSKGRLKEQCEAWLARHGLALTLTGGERGYSGVIQGAPEVEVRLMSASEIGKALLAGEVQAGVTGEDVVREASGEVDALCAFALRLGFGRADVVVAVPNAWMDVDTMADLAEVAADVRRATGRRFRVATKFTRLTAAWFDRHHVLDHRIVDSAGATEGAPAAGIAEAIVDITTTGATLAANGLKVLDDGLILRSEACLITSARAAWPVPDAQALETFLGRFAQA
jgi:ATP phosphoribosyltransferase